METPRRRRRTGFATRLAALAVAASGLAGCPLPWPDLPTSTYETTMVALTVSGRVVTFRDRSPGELLTDVAVTGLVPGDTLVALDARSGQAFAVAGSGRVYGIDPTTGVATPRDDVAPVPIPPGAAVGYDSGGFVTTEDGTVFDVPLPYLDWGYDYGYGSWSVAAYGPLVYAAGEPGAGTAPHVVAAAESYANDVYPGGWYGIDAASDTLFRWSSFGTSGDPTLVTTVGPLGVDATGLATLESATTFRLAAGERPADPERPGIALYAALTAPGASVSELYELDPFTGAASHVGTIGTGEPVLGLGHWDTDDEGPIVGWE